MKCRPLRADNNYDLVAAAGASRAKGDRSASARAWRRRCTLSTRSPSRPHSRLSPGVWRHRPGGGRPGFRSLSRPPRKLRSCPDPCEAPSGSGRFVWVRESTAHGRTASMAARTLSGPEATRKNDREPASGDDFAAERLVMRRPGSTDAAYMRGNRVEDEHVDEGLECGGLIESFGTGHGDRLQDPQGGVFSAHSRPQHFDLFGRHKRDVAAKVQDIGTNPPRPSRRCHLDCFPPIERRAGLSLRARRRSRVPWRR